MAYTWCQRSGDRIPIECAVLEEWSGLVVHESNLYRPPPGPPPVIHPRERHPLYRPNPGEYYLMQPVSATALPVTFNGEVVTFDGEPVTFDGE